METKPAEATATSLWKENAPKVSRRVEKLEKWESIKNDACRLYITEGKTLHETMSIIRESFGFSASVRKWKSQFKEWKAEKNIKSSHMAAIIARAEKIPRDENKPTKIYLGEKEIGYERIKRFKGRKSCHDRDFAAAETLSNIQCCTPEAENSGGAESIELEHARAISPISMSRPGGLLPVEGEQSPKTPNPLSMTQTNTLPHEIQDFDTIMIRARQSLAKMTKGFNLVGIMKISLVVTVATVATVLRYAWKRRQGTRDILLVIEGLMRMLEILSDRLNENKSSAKPEDSGNNNLLGIVAYEVVLAACHSFFMLMAWTFDRARQESRNKIRNLFTLDRKDFGCSMTSLVGTMENKVLHWLTGSNGIPNQGSHFLTSNGPLQAPDSPSSAPQSVYSLPVGDSESHCFEVMEIDQAAPNNEKDDFSDAPDMMEVDQETADETGSVLTGWRSSRLGETFTDGGMSGISFNYTGLWR